MKKEICTQRTRTVWKKEGEYLRAEPIYTMKNRKNKEKEKKVYSIFVDFIAAFDNSKEKLRKILEKKEYII